MPICRGTAKRLGLNRPKGNRVKGYTPIDEVRTFPRWITLVKDVYRVTDPIDHELYEVAEHYELLLAQLFYMPLAGYEKLKEAMKDSCE